MEWHIEYEIFSAIVIMIVMVFYFQNRYVPTLQNRLYRNLLICSLLFILVNIAATLCINHIERVPLLLTSLLNHLYLLFLPLLPAMVLMYVIAIIYEDYKRILNRYLLLFIPLLICYGAAISNPFTHVLFTITKEEGYIRGNGYILTYSTFFFYAVAAAIVSILHRKTIDRYKAMAIQAFLVVTLIAITLQAIYMQYILTGAACAFTILLVHLSMQHKGIMNDELTGALNRQSFIQLLNISIRIQKPGVFIALALNDFKFVNETFGSRNCDAILKQVVNYLSMTANPGRVYRISGDIFIMEQIGKDDEQIMCFIQDIRARFQHSWVVNTVESVLSPRIIVYPYPGNSKTAEEIMNCIDVAIHAAKKQSDQLLVVNAQFENQVMRLHQVKHILESALDNDYFEVYYQPIYSTSLGRYTSCEALLRLHHPTEGYIRPDEFIPIAEETGMIVPIGLLVFEKVCQFIIESNYVAAGFKTISINLSVVQCMQVNIANDIIQLIERYHIPPEVIRLEITETVAAISYQVIQGTMDRLIEYGVTFALDDFGVGYSGMTNLLSLPFQVVKLDKSLIWSMSGDYKRRIAVKHIISLIKSLDMKPVAEGVETSDQLEILNQMSCDYIQGYYFSRPVSQTQLQAIIDEATFNK